MQGTHDAATNPSGYRSELDGFRAIAVCAVLLYHLGVEWIPGGFTGVDVFFVLSGYLITGLLRRELAAETFRYRTFILRRIRRLSPALLFLCAVTSVIAVCLLLPRHLVAHADAIWVQPLALQNIHYLIDGEYFEGSASKTLLHTWSLGVEEQFYLLWPIVMVLLSRYSRRIAIASTVALLLLSFAANLVLMPLSPKAAFFLLPSRAWELATGGLLALVHEGREQSLPSENRARALASLGVGGLVASFCCLDKTMPFPGWIAVLPVAATTALLMALSSGVPTVRRALCLRPVVYVGQISYALYLWHWPIIAIARLEGLAPHEPRTALLIGALSFVLAAASHRWVESPIRQKRVLAGDGQLLCLVAALSCVLLAFSLVVRLTDGLAFLHPEPARTMLTATFHTDGDDRCGFTFRALHPTAPACPITAAASTDAQRILLWGNSHAGMWIGVFDDMASESGARVYLNARNCRAVLDSSFCGPGVQASLLAFIESERITDVVLASSWHGSYARDDADFEAELAQVVAGIAERGARVWLVVDVPVGPELSPHLRYEMNPEAPTFGNIPRASYDAAHRVRELAIFNPLAARIEGVRVVDLSSAYCDDARCYGGRDSTAWYRDSNHVTRTGARRARPMFAPIFDPVE